MNLLLCLSILAAVVEGAEPTASQLINNSPKQKPASFAPGGLLFVCQCAPQATPVALRARVDDHLEIALQPF